MESGERQRLRHNAPHLVHLLPFLIPVFSKDGVIPKPLARALCERANTRNLIYDLR